MRVEAVIKAALPEVWPVFNKVLRKVRVRLLPAETETDRCPAVVVCETTK